MDDSLKKEVMDSILSGKARMRPRWRFALSSAFLALIMIMLFALLLYVASLSAYLMALRASWRLTDFGARGWLSFAASLPWTLIALIAILLALFERLARRLKMVYSRPVVVPAAVIACSVIALSALISPLHARLRHLAGRYPAVPLFSIPYAAQADRPADGVYDGTVVSEGKGEYVIADADGQGTTTVVMLPRTLFPLRSAIPLGARVMVIGDTVAAATVQAYGIEEVDD